ncbi:hypothetical protein FRC0043_00277 [Corynebacterium belfantii]|nr:hypothetical protein FRC0043_00277 [Corynebacterium belfantii]
MVDIPPVLAKLSMNPPVAVTMVRLCEDLDDRFLEIDMFIRHVQALLVIEKC